MNSRKNLETLDDLTASTSPGRSNYYVNPLSFPPQSCKLSRLIATAFSFSFFVYFLRVLLCSEPAIQKCNPQKEVTGNSDWITVLGFLIAVGAIVMATFSTGIDSQSFQYRKDESQWEDDIPYTYEFFHIVFSLGATYFAMLFINWDLDSSTKEWSIDVGWASTWVKIVNEWFAATIYLWKLISPVVREIKVMDHEETMERPDDSDRP